MKKRTKFFIFIFCLVFGLYFLFPTIKWYFYFNDNDKNEARLEGDKLKFAITDEVNASLKKLNNGEKLNKEIAAISDKLNNELRVYNKLNPEDKIKLDKNPDYKEIKSILLKLKKKDELVDAFVKDILEDYYKNTYKEKKNVKDNIIKLGLESSGRCLRSCFS